MCDLEVIGIPSIPLNPTKSGPITPYDFHTTFRVFKPQNDVSNLPKCNRTLGKVVEGESTITL